ncbi:MAG: cofC 2 [Marmoricola sp.]|nr:cofC 2 [Marmoricola sp.]
MTAHVLVTAKAPIPGQAKTRLGAVIGMRAAAELAAAALLDTLDACAASGLEPHLALEGDLRLAERGEEILAALDGWNVFDQCSGSFGERLAHAHRTVSGHGVVVQIGTDTPQVTGRLLHDVAEEADRAAVLGSALDGGWWVLAWEHGARADLLADVTMSTTSTYDDTWAALIGAGIAVRDTATLRDVDTVEDAHAVALAVPTTRFARTWTALTEVAS